MHEYKVQIFYLGNKVTVYLQRHGVTLHTEEGKRSKLAVLVHRVTMTMVKLEEEEMDA